MHTQESGKGMKKLRNNKIRKLLAFMVALALMVSCMPSAYTISASEAFGDGTEDIFTDGEITSEPAAEESTPDVSSADQEETEQAQQSTLTYENDSVKVTAEALEDGALPQNTALKADGVNENSSVSYDTVSQKLSAAATDKGSSLRGFFAYDVYFADGDGNRVEPNGRVRVTFEYKTPAAPELTDAASTSVTVEKLHYNSSTGDTDVNTLQANEDLKVLNVNEGKQIQTLQVETGNAAVFAVMWDSPETADVEAEAVSGNEDEVSIASEELTDGMDISDEPEQDAAETPAAENPEVTPDAEPSEAPAENPDAEPTEAPAEDPDVVEEPAEDIASPDEVPAADENGETSLIEVLGDDTNLRVSPSIEAEVLATVNAGKQLTLLDTVTAEDGATWYKVSWEGTEAYIRSDMAQVVDSSDEAEEVEDVLESEEVSYSQTIGDVVVTATAASGVLPKDAQFVVNPIEKGSDQYTDVADRLEKKAENEEYSIAGFLAYDIYFQDSEGNKINPEEGKVKVSMEYQNATAPDEVKEADAATMAMASADENSQDDTETAEQNLSVSVMHFVEDANGNVESVVDMTKDDTANVETNAEGEVQKAEFETESFSTFSIIWTYSNNWNATLTVHLIDTKGAELSGTVESKEADQDNGANFKLAELGKKYAPEGYAYKNAKASNKTTTINYISFNSTGGSGYGWYCIKENENNWTRVSRSSTYSIYLVYEPVSAWIKDDIMNTGNLIPETNDSIKEKINAADKVTYTWSKSVDGGKTYTQVERTKHGDKYNLSEEGKLLNVALDGGALNSKQKSVQYKVKIEITKDGTTEKVETEPFNNEYWNELQNGSFETPEYTSMATGQFTNDYYKNAGGVWQSTGEGKNGSGNTVNIEIVNARTNSGFKGSYSWYGDGAAKEGNQFAELNCEAAGALYQDVMTYEGESMNYWLSHRARGSVQSVNSEFDTMYLVIMPTSVAMTAADGSELKTQDQLESYLKLVLPSLNVKQAYSTTDDDILYNQNGILISRITSDDQSWHDVVRSVYRTTSYLTRFFFVSGDTASGKNTVGNFLDKVGFSQSLPPASPDKFNLQVKKNITGLTAEQIESLEEKLTFTIKATNNGQEVTDAKLKLNNKQLKLTDENVEKSYDAVTGTYSYVWTFVDQEIKYGARYVFSVTESDAELEGYTLTKNLKIVGDNVQEDGKSTLIGGGGSASFEFTNNYVSNKKKNVSFTKIWDDYDNAYNTRPDSLTVTLEGTVGEKVVKSYSATLQKNSATLSSENNDNDNVTVESPGDWKCTWKNVPVRDDKGNVITWSVKESEVNGAYKYEQAASGKGNGSFYTKENTSTAGNITTSEIEGGEIPGSSNNTAVQSVQNNVSSNDIAVQSADSSNEYGIATMAWNRSTFNHIDIEAVGNYTFEYGEKNYTVHFDFHAGTWTLYEGTSASGTAVGNGKVDVSTFKITNKTAASDVAISGNWQSSTTSGQTWEYRISGTFNRSDAFHVHYEIPVVINGITINLVADFDTSYNDGTYNVCPGNGNSKGIDIEMDSALAKEMTGTIVLTKVINGTNNAVPDNISFTVTGDGINKTIPYEDFTNGSYVISGLNAGTEYTVTESGTGTLDGYTYNSTTVAVNGGSAVSGTGTTVTTTSGMTVVTFSNTYTEVPKEHTLLFKKVWNGGSGSQSNTDINLNVTYSNDTTETITLNKRNNWQITKSVAADVFIKNVTENGNIKDYTPTVTISADRTTAIVTNTYTSTTEKTLTVVKVWSGDEEHTDLRSAKVQVQLYQNGATYGNPVELSEANGWTYTFKELPASKTTGETTTNYSYSVSEITKVAGYDSTVSYNSNQTVATVTNTLNGEELDESFYIANKLTTDTVTVNKYWDDNHNQYGSRPSSLKINLSGSGQQRVVSFDFGAGENNTANQWQATVTVPKLTTGGYSAEEELPGETNYQCSASQKSGDNIYFVNKPLTQTIIVEKIWNDANNASGMRPESVKFKLQCRTKGSTDDWRDYNYNDGSFAITKKDADSGNSNYWYYKITDLPVTNEYRVVESEVSNYTATRNSAISITNTLNWKVVKKSSNPDSNGIPLGGAEFKLTDSNNTTVATGVSGSETGEITWTINKGVTLNGDYTLTETKAPNGYFISRTTWKLTFENGVLTNGVSNNDGKNCKWESNKATLTITNDALYKLPNSGGPGTYGFTISGVAILATALLLFINNKRREEKAKRS